MPSVHVIGAGLSGLACAVAVARAGMRVVVYEAAAHAGGRCRSFQDESLGCMLDNGNHVVLGGNEATLSYLDAIGSRDRLSDVSPAAFPFLDLRTRQRWMLRPNPGLVPWWVIVPGRRVPDTRVSDYLGVLSLARAGAADSVADCVGVTGALYEKLWQPMTQAVLNTDATEASARLLWRVVAAIFLKGESAARPCLFPFGLSPTLIDPAFATLRAADAELRLRARLRAFDVHEKRVFGLQFTGGRVALGPDDVVVLAVPPDAASDLLPEISVPSGSRAIVNAHFRPAERIRLPGGLSFLGIIGRGQAQWLSPAAPNPIRLANLFLAGDWTATGLPATIRDDILSVTVSAADSLAEKPSWDIANTIWHDVARVLERNVGRIPPWRIIKERRATFAQTPFEVARRPKAPYRPRQSLPRWRLDRDRAAGDHRRKYSVCRANGGPACPCPRSNPNRIGGEKITQRVTRHST